MTPRILVAGEALVDLFVDTAQPVPVRAGLPMLAVAGGSPFNLAIGIARLGTPSAFLGGLSSDPFGRMLAERLTAEGVDLAFARVSARPTPLAIVATGPDGHPAYSFYAEGSAHADLDAAHLPASLPDTIAALALGSFSLASEPVGSSLAALAEREGGRRVVSLDPNIRLSLVGDLVRWRARFESLVCHAAIVKASDEDLQTAYGGDTDLADHAARWLAAGALLVIVTAGADGASAFSRQGCVTVPAQPSEVMDTVGAGDTFHAALLARLARDGRLSRPALASLNLDQIRTLLTEACAAASITCSRRGADLPTLPELQASLRSTA